MQKRPGLENIKMAWEENSVVDACIVCMAAESKGSAASSSSHQDFWIQSVVPRPPGVVEMDSNNCTASPTTHRVRRRGCHSRSESSCTAPADPHTTTTIQRRHQCPLGAAAELRHTADPPHSGTIPTWIAPRSLLKKIHTGGRVILFLSVSHNQTSFSRHTVGPCRRWQLPVWQAGQLDNTSSDWAQYLHNSLSFPKQKENPGF